ncbi:hypothetical protein X551_04696 [Methylibium sp. T29]|nr:hypothetical protein X551_04696 [Methylibium sp. T29]
MVCRGEQSSPLVYSVTRQKILQLGRRQRRQLLGNEVPGRHRVAAHRAAARGLPVGDRLELLRHHAARAPQHVQVTGHALAGLAAGAVVLQVDAGGGAVVLAGAVNALGRAEAAVVVGQRLGFDEGDAFASPAAQRVPQVPARVGADLLLGQRRGLDQVEPVVVGLREGHVGALVHRQRGHDVQHAQLAHRLRMVQRQPVCHAPAAVVAGHEEALVAQRAHHAHHVGRHRALAVVGVVVRAGRLGRAAVAAQVGHHQPVAVGQPLRRAMPDRVRLRVAVQQQQRRPVGRAADAGEQRHAVDVERAALEAFEPVAAHRRCSVVRRGARHSSSAVITSPSRVARCVCATAVSRSGCPAGTWRRSRTSSESRPPGCVLTRRDHASAPSTSTRSSCQASPLPCAFTARLQ